MNMVVSIISITISVLTFLGVGALMQQIIKEKHAQRLEKKRKNSEQVQQEEKAARQEEMREVISSELSPLDNRLNELEKRLAKVEEQLSLNSEGTLSTMRKDLLDSYYACANRGYRTRYESESFRKMYATYIAMHGNTFVQDDIKHWFEEIPAKENSKYTNNEQEGE